MKTDTYISRSGRVFSSKYLATALAWALKIEWIPSTWKPKDALIDKNGGTSRPYTGQSFDDQKIDLVENGWTHDHCEICGTEIREDDKCALSDDIYICEYCFSDFIKDPN